MKTIKNTHSPAGMPFFTTRSLRYEKDCPKCKYGTLVPWLAPFPEKTQTVLGERCIDCGHKIPVKK